MNLKEFGIIIFTKTPGISPVMTRLGISQEKANATQTLLIKLIKENLSSQQVSWAIAEQRANAHPLWKGESLILQEGETFGERLVSIIEKAQSKFKSFIISSSDYPLLNCNVIQESRTLLSKNDYVFTPAQDGGFTTLAMNKSSSLEPFRNVIYSQESTLSQILKAIEKPAYSLLTTSYDIDTMRELLKFIKETKKTKDHHLIIEKLEKIIYE